MRLFGVRFHFLPMDAFLPYPPVPSKSPRMQYPGHRIFTAFRVLSTSKRYMSLHVFNNVPDTQQKLIGTHDGSFHCDECLAVAMLKMTPTFKDAVVIRTRNPDILAKCNIVVDVGAKYEPENLLFDHHQKEFQGTMNTGVHQYNTRLSSAGLVYKHYGKEIVAGLATGAAEDEVAQVYDRVYSGFMEHIDGIDNGVEPFAAASGEKLTKNYVVSTSLSSRVGNLAPRWNQPTDAESFNQGFVKAVALVTTEFLASVDYYANAWLPAAQVVKKCVADRLNVHESGRIVHLDTFCPWQEHLYDIERTLGLSGEVLYCLFPDSNRGYRIRAVSDEGSSFGLRKALPWKGLRDGDLVAASGIAGGVFVHASGFIAGNDTYEGALQMAVKALSEE